MNKKYHVSDVIFGLREEYLKIESLLNELKKNVYIHDKRVADFYFYLATYYSKKYPELLCNVEKKRNIVTQKLISFAKKERKSWGL